VFNELIQGRSLYLYHAQTDVAGGWSITLSKAFRRNAAWRAVFPGSDTEAGTTRPGHAVDVIPALGERAPTTAGRGALFTVKGSSTPNMHGAKVALQERRSTRGRWHTIADVAVGRRGTFSRRISFSTAGAAYVRWHYAGGKRKSWMSATSRIRKVAIH